MDENNKNSNITQIALVALLVVAAFFIGILSNRIKQPESENIAQVPAEAGNVAGAEVSGTASIEEALVGLDLNQEELYACLESGEFSQRVENEFQSGAKAGVNGTPGNILFDTQTGLALDIAGALPVEMLEESLNDLKAGNGEKIDVDPVTEDDYIRGDSNARFILFEYSDYECFYCGMFHGTAKEFIENYEGEIAWVYRQFPLGDLQSSSREKSEAVLCAGKIGGNDAFWALSDALLGL